MAAGAALLYLATVGGPLAWLGSLAKPVPALALAAWVATAAGGARLVAAGLVFSALGDLLLEHPGGFLGGLGAFLAAHLLYTASFVRDAPRLHLGRLLPFALYAGAAWSVLGPGVPPALRAPVIAYTVAISAMMWRAAARVGTAGTPAGAAWLGLAGAVTFAASDTLIALDRFRSPIPGVRYPIITLYWLGQLGIAGSAVRRAARS